MWQSYSNMAKRKQSLSSRLEYLKAAESELPFHQDVIEDYRESKMVTLGVAGFPLKLPTRMLPKLPRLPSWGLRGLPGGVPNTISGR